MHIVEQNGVFVLIRFLLGFVQPGSVVLETAGFKTVFHLYIVTLGANNQCQYVMPLPHGNVMCYANM